jgi:hypothetical protein
MHGLVDWQSSSNLPDSPACFPQSLYIRRMYGTVGQGACVHQQIAVSVLRSLQALQHLIGIEVIFIVSLSVTPDTGLKRVAYFIMFVFILFPGVLGHSAMLRILEPIGK